MAHQYPNQQEKLLAKVRGKTGKISDRTHEEHMKLYTGYVNKTNAILAELEKLGAPDPANAAVANQIFSTVRSLKTDFTFAIGGLINHEIYFNNLGGGGGQPTGKVGELIKKSFGGYDNYVEDLKATGISGRGWAWTGFDPRTGLLFNYLGDAQNTFPVWGVKPILALDVYEHAYYLDFGTARAGYIDEFLKFVDWNNVNANLDA